MSASREGVVEFPCDVERLASGNTLIADAGDEAGAGSEVVEVTPAGEVVWRYGGDLRFAHAAKRLASGNTLIADTTNDRVIEVTPTGEIVFTSDDWTGGNGTLSDGSHLCYPNDAHELENGKLLITDRNNDRAVEVSREGKVAWQLAGRVERPHNADRLPNGNTIVCDSGGEYIREFTPSLEIAWSYGDGETSTLHWPRDADRLANGNTLITDSKNRRVIEITPAGELAWEYAADYFSNFYDADRLPNGNTLIASQQHQEVIEVTPTGEVVWRFRNYSRPYPIYEAVQNPHFEKADASGAPAQWVLGRRFSEGGGELVWTENAKGKKCPGLAYDREGALTLQQTVRVEPGARLRLEALIKTDALDGIAFVQAAFIDEMNGLLCDVTKAPRSRPFMDSTDWTPAVVAAPVPERAVAAEVRLFVTGKGRAFFDEVRFAV